MTIQYISWRKKCAPMAAAGAGMAVCLTSGSAGAVTGSFSGSNTDKTFTANQAINVFNSLASFTFRNIGKEYFSGTARLGVPRFQRGGGSYFAQLSDGVTVGPGPLFDYGAVPPNVSDKYVGVRFSSGGTKYGWMHMISSSANSSQVIMDTWGYDETGGDIRTLANAVTPRKLHLSDGKVALSWSSRNEAGVARYEVQRKDDTGAWTATGAETPGAGSYSLKAPGDGEYRLLIEFTDGTTQEQPFAEPSQVHAQPD